MNRTYVLVLAVTLTLLIPAAVAAPAAADGCLPSNSPLLGAPYATTAAAPAATSSTTAAMIDTYKATPQASMNCLAYLRAALAERSLEDHERLMKLKRLDLGLPDNDKEHDSIRAQIQSLQKDLDALGTAGFTPETMPQYIENYDVYPPLYYTFFAGAEYRNVNGIFQNGFPDIGLFLYERPQGRDTVPKHFIPDGYATISLASSSEQHIGAPSGATVSAPSIGTGARALQADINFFWPVAATNLNPNQNYIGPMVDFGVRKTDTVQEFDRRVYYGLREAVSPDFYVELLYGRTASLNTKRFEIRAQMPIYDFHNSTKLYIGADANLAHGHPDNPAATADPDTFVIYLIWNVPFSSILQAAGAPAGGATAPP